jgi:hypothetical protein
MIEHETEIKISGSRKLCKSNTYLFCAYSSTSAAQVTFMYTDLAE